MVFTDLSSINVKGCLPRLSRYRRGHGWLVVVVFGLLLVQTGQAQECPRGPGLTLQVLGSGGPVADDDRASSAYLVWQDGQARVMVDAGGGSFLRFGQARARFEDLDLIAISHFHADHSADLPALLKAGYFSSRARRLSISGPEEGGPFPALKAFVDRLVGGRGAFAYLSGYLDGSDGLVALDLLAVDHRNEKSATVVDQDGLRVTALGVPHGIVPTLAYRVEANGQSIVFGSDQNGSSARFSEFAQGASILIAHLAIPESASGVARKLHAPPSVIGRIARESGTQTLVLSHLMSRSLEDLPNSLALIRLQFSGNIILAEDLQCYEAEQNPREFKLDNERRNPN